MHFSNWQNKLTALWLLVLLLVGASMLTAWLNKDIHIQTNIFALLPEIEQDQALAKTQEHVNQQLNNQVFVVIDAKDQAQLEKATQYLAEQVKHSELWRPLKPQLDTEQFGKTLYQHQAALLAAQDIAYLQQQDYAALTEQSLMQMMTPGMPITAEQLQRDPLMLFPRFAMSLATQNTQSNVEIQQGFATVQDEHGLSRLLTLELTQSPYQMDYQEKTKAWIEQTDHRLEDLGVQVHWTGTLIFSSDGTQSAKNEISTIGVGSGLGVLLLVWFGFRSFRPMLTEFIAVSTGSMVAFAVTHWMFSEIHLMTLVFGASLIGVCVDFSFYFMALQSQHRQVNGFAVLKPVLPSLLMGLITTLLAYLFLTFTPFPGFKQIAVFSMVGLTSAWITSILLLPRLAPLNAEPAIRRLSFVGNLRDRVQSRPRLRGGLIAGIVSIAGVSILFLQANDDVRNLQSMDQTLKQEDHYVRTRFNQQQSSDYFVVQGKTPAEMAQNEHALIEKLQRLQAEGAVQNFQALGVTIPSLQQQAQNIQLLQRIPAEELNQYADALQLDRAEVLAWQRNLSQQSALRLQDFVQHPLAFLEVSPTQRLVLLQGVSNIASLQALQNDALHLVRPVQDLTDLFQAHRVQAQYLLFYAWISLIVGIGLIYGLRGILPLVLPVSLALLSTFAVQAWLGVEINLFSLMAVFLVMGIGVDYAIFYRHGHDHPQVVGMALFLCMMSTLLGFGLLALSQTYAIYSFGLTVLFGVIFSFTYATLFTTVDPRDQPLFSDQSKN